MAVIPKELIRILRSIIPLDETVREIEEQRELNGGKRRVKFIPREVHSKTKYQEN